MTAIELAAPAADTNKQTDPNQLHLIDTFDNPGVFPKFLARVGHQLLFLDLQSIATLSGNGRTLAVDVFGWYMDEQFQLHRTNMEGREFFPAAPDKPHTGERLKFLMISGNGNTIPIERPFLDLGSAGALFASGWLPVNFGPYAIGETFIVWKMADRHQRAISDAADEYSASK